MNVQVIPALWGTGFDDVWVKFFTDVLSMWAWEYTGSIIYLQHLMIKGEIPGLWNNWHCPLKISTWEGMQKNKLLVYPATLTNFINVLFVINAKGAKEHILCDSISMMFGKVDRLGRRMRETYRVLKGFCILIWMMGLWVYTLICTVQLG